MINFLLLLWYRFFLTLLLVRGFDIHTLHMWSISKDHNQWIQIYSIKIPYVSWLSMRIFIASITVTSGVRLKFYGSFNSFSFVSCLTHWGGLMTHICVSKQTIIGSDNGLSPGRRQAIIWTNAGILLIGPWGTKFSDILIVFQTVSFKKMHLKMSSAKWRPFCLGLNVLNVEIGSRDEITKRLSDTLNKISIAWYRTVLTPLLRHWSYHKFSVKPSI